MSDVKQLDYQIRSLGKIDIREVDGGGITIGGEAVVYNSETDALFEKIYGFTEIIAPGAFAGYADVRLLIEHAGLPIARTTSGTLKLSDDAGSLRFESTLDGSDPDVRALVPKLRRGDVKHMSFGFVADQVKWDEVRDLRTVLKGHLMEVSIVGNPAYPATSCESRSMQKQSMPKKPTPAMYPTESAHARLKLLSL